MLLTFDDEKNKKRVEELYRKEEEDLARILSKKYGIPYADLTVQTIDTNGLRLIPEEEARAAKLAIFDLVGRKIKIAVLSPSFDKTTSTVKMLENHGYLIERYLVSTQSLERAWSRYKDISYSTESKAGELDIANKEIEDLTKNVRSVEDVRKMITDVIKMKKSFKISRIVEVIAAGAIAIGASDIHVEPEEFDTRVRFRLDGILVDITRLDMETFKLLLSRIKLLSGMKLNVKNLSQDGRFTIHLTDNEIEIRSSILPGAYLETIVMRLLNPKSIGVPLEELGIREDLLEIFLREIDKPNGMILNTGPTGSGKTTTLYAFLKKKKTPEVKIITIEDPIEYHLPGIVQTQVDNKKGYTFASGLKSSLRQDPDVLMVGEIRDLNTAETAVHAALTGHLVFSTLHTNNAVGAFARLIDLGINPKILTSAINLVIAQRLVRRLCQSCKKKATLSPENSTLLKGIYDSIQTPPIPWSETFYEAQGCTDCNGLGYKGRIGIYEAVVSDKIIEEILQRNPSESELKKATRTQGIMDMSQDGVIKILQGITTISEVERVVDIRTGETHRENIQISEVPVPAPVAHTTPEIISTPAKKEINEPVAEITPIKKEDVKEKIPPETSIEKPILTTQSIREEIVSTPATATKPDTVTKEESSSTPIKIKIKDENPVAIKKSSIASEKKVYSPRPDIVLKKKASPVPVMPEKVIEEKKEKEIKINTEEKVREEKIAKIQEEERIKRVQERQKLEEEKFLLKKEQAEREKKEKEKNYKPSFIEEEADNLSVELASKENPTEKKEIKKETLHFLEEEPDTLSSKKISEENNPNTAKIESKKDKVDLIIDDEEDLPKNKKEWDIFDEDEEDTLAF